MNYFNKRCVAFKCRRPIQAKESIANIIHQRFIKRPIQAKKSVANFLHQRFIRRPIQAKESVSDILHLMFCESLQEL
jgi:hypothetical protein